jgi:hypothetical protein
MIFKKKMKEKKTFKLIEQLTHQHKKKLKVDSLISVQSRK